MQRKPQRVSSPTKHQQSCEAVNAHTSPQRQTSHESRARPCAWRCPAGASDACNLEQFLRIKSKEVCGRYWWLDRRLRACSGDSFGSLHFLTLCPRTARRQLTMTARSAPGYMYRYNCKAQDRVVFTGVYFYVMTCHGLGPAVAVRGQGAAPGCRGPRGAFSTSGAGALARAIIPSRLTI